MQRILCLNFVKFALLQIGVNAGDNVNYYMLCVSRTEDVLNIKELAMTPCGEPGLIVFRMDAINPDQGNQCHCRANSCPEYSGFAGKKKFIQPRSSE